MNPDRLSTDSVLLHVSLWRWLSVVLSPFLFTVVVLTVVFIATGGTSPVPQLPTGVYSLLSVLVVALLVQRLSQPARTEILPTHTPRRTEMAVAAIAALVTIFVFDPVATFVTSVLGSGNGTPARSTLRSGQLSSLSVPSSLHRSLRSTCSEESPSTHFGLGTAWQWSSSAPAPCSVQSTF